MRVMKLYGPPGTGKTHALLEIMERELAGGVKPNRLGYVAFTVKAIEEAKARACAMLKANPDDFPFFRTLHSIAYRQLGMSSAGMLTRKDDYAKLSEVIGYEVTGKGGGEHAAVGRVSGDKLLQVEDYRRHCQLTIDEALNAFPDLYISRWDLDYFSRSYAAWKDAEGFSDFTDLLIRAEDPLPVDVVIVDEAQDLSKLQWAALRRFVANAERVYLAGDDDQAIFAWAGADPQSFIDFPADETKVLGQSYRVPRAVQKEALALIGNVRGRVEKKWAPRAVEGSVGRIGTLEQIKYPESGTSLVLCRHRFQRDLFEAELRRQGMVYRRNDRAAPGMEYAPAILAWEDLRKGHPVSHSQATLIYEAMRVGPSLDRGARQKLEADADMGHTYSMDTLRDRYGLKVSEPWFLALSAIRPEPAQFLRAVIKRDHRKGLTDPPRIVVSTIHGAKGGQADHVYLLTDVTRKVDEAMYKHPDPERRVFYVGMTRARESLTFVGFNQLRL